MFPRAVYIVTPDIDQYIANLSDPSGASLILADEEGHKRGHILYDPFGGLLSHTLSLSDSALLADQLPGPSTGLVHLGHG